MLVQLLYGAILLSVTFCSTHADSNTPAKPNFAFSWVDDKGEFTAGGTATINIKILGAFDPKSYKHAFRPTILVNGKAGNSTYISGLLFNFGNDLNTWNISFTPILVGVFDVFITDDYFSVLDSSLHFNVKPGPMHAAVSIALWMDFVDEFVAGTRAMLLIFPKDAFGNNLPTTNADLNSYIFNISATHTNGSTASVLSLTNLGWSNNGYLRVEFIAATAGNLLLHVRKKDLTLRGSPLRFKVHPGKLDISKCTAKWNFGTNALQIFSKKEIFIHQLDIYGNLVPGFYPFDAEIIEKGTNLSTPVADLNFKEISPGIQLLSFSALEPGNFLLMIYDAKHNKSIANMPYDFTVFVGYCDGSSSIINGSGLNASIAGEPTKFSVYLRDEYQYPSPVELGRLQVQIMGGTDIQPVLPSIHPIETVGGSELSRHQTFDAVGHMELSPQPSADLNDTSGNSKVLAHAYEVSFTPEKSGFYDIHALCGNIPLNNGHSLKKEVRAGQVNISLSGVVNFASKIPKKTKNGITVQLMDSFHNPVLSQKDKLKIGMDSINNSGYTTWNFSDNNNGLYIVYYLAEDVGTYEICLSFDREHFIPCPFGVNVYTSEYFPKAFDDSVSVWEDESIAFDALENDYFAGGNATVVETSYPRHGSLLHNVWLFRYTPYKGFYGNDSFSYTILDVNGNVGSASVNISVLSIPPQFVAFPSQLQATEDIISPKFGGFPGFEITYPDSLENISVILAAKSGTISLSPMLMQLWHPIWNGFSVSKWDGESDGLKLVGCLEVINVALQSIQYLGNEDFYGDDTIRIFSMNQNGVNDLNVTVTVEPVNDPPFIRIPEYVLLEENDNENGSRIYDQKRDKFEFLIGDPDLSEFPGNKSQFLVMLSMEVDSGIIETVLPAQLINTTELKLKNSHRWQPLQTFVTISKHFAVKAKGLRFQGTVDHCNEVIQQLRFHGEGFGAVLTITINDMGNYGCYPDCAENMSKALFSEANINLIKARPINSLEAKALGAAIIIEFMGVLSLGVLLVYFTCRCAFSLVNDRNNTSDVKENTLPRVRNSGEQTSIMNNTSRKGACFLHDGAWLSPFLFLSKPFNFGQRSRRQSGGQTSSEKVKYLPGDQSRQLRASSFHSHAIENGQTLMNL